MNPTLKQVLECYLMNLTMRVVQQLYNRFSGYLTKYELSDLFHATYSLVHQRFFYNEKHRFSIPSQRTISNFFLKYVRQEQPYFMVSNLGIAVRSSLRKWLEVAINIEQREQFIILYGCLQRLKDSTDLPCNKWGTIEFTILTNDYCKYRESYPLLNSEEIINLLNKIGKDIRSLSSIQPIYFDASLRENSGDNSTLLDYIAAPQTSALEFLELQEFLELLREYLKIILIKLKPQKRLILYYLFYQRNTQLETANIVGVNQATVSRTRSNFCQQFGSVMKDHIISISTISDTELNTIIFQTIVAVIVDFHTAEETS